MLVLVASLASAQESPEAAPCAPPAPLVAPAETWAHGFRVGYAYVANLPPDGPLRSPHLFVLGYELTERALGGSWLDVIVVENLSVSGINQSVFVPTGNLLVGFGIARQLELGTGVNVSPLDPYGKVLHQVIAVGWTPRAGAFRVPVHATLVPDVDGQWRLGTTIGVNW